MRGDANVKKSGTNNDGLTWTVRFTEGGTFETAWNELQRPGLAGECVVAAALSRERRILEHLRYHGDPTEERPLV